MVTSSVNCKTHTHTNSVFTKSESYTTNTHTLTHFALIKCKPAQLQFIGEKDQFIYITENTRDKSHGRHDPSSMKYLNTH